MATLVKYLVCPPTANSLWRLRRCLYHFICPVYRQGSVVTPSRLGASHTAASLWSPLDGTPALTFQVIGRCVPHPRLPKPVSQVQFQETFLWIGPNSSVLPAHSSWALCTQSLPVQGFSPQVSAALSCSHFHWLGAPVHSHFQAAGGREKSRVRTGRDALESFLGAQSWGS